MKTLNIGQDFSPDPSGRFRADSDASGEAFREDCLLPKLRSLSDDEKLRIILDDGVEAYGSSFLTEGFAGIVKYGYYTSDEFISKIIIEYSDKYFEFYKNKIFEYVNKGSMGSDTIDLSFITILQADP